MDGTRLRPAGPAHAAWVAAGLVLLALAFLPGLTAPFVFDDARNITDNPQVHLRHPLDLSTLLRPNPYADPSRPLAYWSFGVNGLLTGLTPAGLRAGNILLHLGNALLLYLLGRSLLAALGMGERGRWGALAGALLWGAHPLNSQPVLFVVQRMTLLAGTFTLLGLWLYLEGRGKEGRARLVRWGLILPAFLLASLSKGTGLLLPAGILLLELLLSSASPSLPRRALRWVPVAGALALAGGLWFFLSVHPATFDPAVWNRPFTPGERVLTEGRVLAGYLGQFLLPLPGRFHLLHDPQPSTGLLSPPSTLAAWALLLALAAAALAAWRKAPLFSFSVLWFLAFHAPEAGPVPLELAYEHRNYLPLALPCLMLGAAAASWTGRARRRGLALILLAALLLALALSTSARARAWTRPEAFLRADLAASPASARLAALTARRLKDAGRPAEAEALLRAFLARHPRPVEYARGRGLADIHILLGNLRLAAGDDAGAEAGYLAALREVPGHALALWNLALVKEARGDWRGALEALDGIARTLPTWPNLHRERAKALRALGDEVRAREAERLAPVSPEPAIP